MFTRPLYDTFVEVCTVQPPFCDMYNSCKIHHLSGTQSTDNHIGKLKEFRSSRDPSLFAALIYLFSLYFYSSTSLFVHFIFR